MHLRSATAADVDELVAFSRQSFTRAFGHLYAAEDLAAFLDEYRSPARFAAIIADHGKSNGRLNVDSSTVSANALTTG